MAENVKKINSEETKAKVDPNEMDNLRFFNKTFGRQIFSGEKNVYVSAAIQTFDKNDQKKIFVRTESDVLELPRKSILNKKNPAFHEMYIFDTKSVFSEEDTDAEDEDNNFKTIGSK